MSPCLTMASTSKSSSAVLVRPTLSVSSCLISACFSRHLASSSMMDWSGPSTSSNEVRSTERHLHGTHACTVAARGASCSSARSPKYWYCWRRISSCGVSCSSDGSSLRVHTTLPSTMMKKVLPDSPCVMMFSPALNLTSDMMSCSRCSCTVESDLRMSTERSTFVSVCADDFISTRRNDERAIAHSTPSVSAVTVAARGLEYMSASSPKQWCTPPSFLYVKMCTSFSLPGSPCFCVTANTPASTT
mmetsp:Transcript_15305/g.39789  ORF Transcript_15305/g.39789 Transcript_15305/m.39789 type:complete len:246 (+) Transcript_15305:631-1368(+)